jgi:hypothetical protein
MHALRPIRKIVEHVRATSQPSSNLPRLGQPAVPQRFSLARVRQAIASSARKGPVCAVEQRDPAPAVLAIGLDVELRLARGLRRRWQG